MNSKLIMKYPASWQNDMWREGAPFGNGKIGGSVYGGAAKEIIMLNHTFLWRGGKTPEMPAVNDILPEIRRLLDEHKIGEADSLLSRTLTERGYNPELPIPLPLCDIGFLTENLGEVKHYRRIVDMSKAEVTVEFDSAFGRMKRSCFVSRENDLVCVKYTCDGKPFDTEVYLTHHDTETIGEYKIIDEKTEVTEDTICYSAYSESCYNGGDYGAAAKVVCNGEISQCADKLKVAGATEIFVFAKLFVASEREKAISNIKALLSREISYENELSKHEKLHKKLFCGVDFHINGGDGDTSNEEMLLCAFEEEASAEMIEKLYAYGRYLFICATSDKESLPCHLLGLYGGSYQCFWAFNMFNVNFEMIYWQALSGNLPSFLKAALDYIESQIDDYKENARKIFGCRGIWINSVNAPDSGLSKCLANHIVNWMGGAAWVGQHFWDYYIYTGDTEYLKNHTIPFLYEVALFFEDFAVLDDDGYYDLYPVASPENTATNVKNKYGTDVETSKNATFEIAVFKEAISNLVKGCKITGCHSVEIGKWEEMLKKMRPYRINDDGGIAEWADDFYVDNDLHRHQSHLYPVFPGKEVDNSHPLYKAFEKAEDLRLSRGLYSMSSWSTVYAAGVYSRFGRGDDSLKAIETVAKTCLTNSFLSLHNDWRRMGAVWCDDMRIAPYQVDANIGISAVINEMLLTVRTDCTEILSALPVKWRSGYIKGIAAENGVTFDIFWDKDKATVKAISKNETKLCIRLGSDFKFEDKLKEKTFDLCGETEFCIYR